MNYKGKKRVSVRKILSAAGILVGLITVFAGVSGIENETLTLLRGVSYSVAGLACMLVGTWLQE